MRSIDVYANVCFWASTWEITNFIKQRPERQGSITSLQGKQPSTHRFTYIICPACVLYMQLCANNILIKPGHLLELKKQTLVESENEKLDGVIL